MIAYKVVMKGTRYGSNYLMFFNNLKRSNAYGTRTDKNIARSIRRIIRKLELEKYFPRYKKGTIVKAAPRSSGILCFETIYDAGDFMSKHFIGDSEIIKVDGIRKRKGPVKIVTQCGANIRNLKKKDKIVTSYTRVIAFSKVKVLE